jgi:hypothetical protein
MPIAPPTAPVIETAAIAQHGNQLLHLTPHVLYGTKGQCRLHADPALEAEPVAVPALQLSRIHPIRAELERP